MHALNHVKILLSSISGQKTASTRSVHIYMDVGIVNPFPADHFKINNKNDNPKIIVGVVLLHFQEPATRKNCNTNVTI